LQRSIRDIAFGLVMLAGGGLFWWEMSKPRYQVDRMQDYGFDPVFFPRILIYIWLGLALLMVARALLFTGRPGDSQNWGAVLGTILLVFFYAGAISFVGFLFASVPFAAALMLFLGFRRPLIVGAVSLLFPLVTWYCFNFLLNIPLPTSPWFVRM
jgi:putative tricarboxylic transport membrane protein